MAQLKVDDAGIFYKEAGVGAPLLLIHGTGGDADKFDRVIPLFAKSRRVIAYDRRGFSRSAATPAGPKGYFRRHADDAAALLRGLDAAPATICGWSGGAIVALNLALYHPETVKDLAVYEPPLHAKKHMTLAVARAFIKTMLLRHLGMKRAGAARFYRLALTDANGRSGFDELAPAARESLLANADAVMAELDAGTGEELHAEQIKRISCPISLIVGGLTAPFIGAAAERFIEMVPSVRVVRVPDAGHLMNIEQPDRFVAAVL